MSPLTIIFFFVSCVSGISSLLCVYFIWRGKNSTSGFNKFDVTLVAVSFVLYHSSYVLHLALQLGNFRLGRIVKYRDFLQIYSVLSLLSSCFIGFVLFSSLRLQLSIWLSLIKQGNPRADNSTRLFLWCEKHGKLMVLLIMVIFIITEISVFLAFLPRYHMSSQIVPFFSFSLILLNIICFSPICFTLLRLAFKIHRSPEPPNERTSRLRNESLRLGLLDLVGILVGLGWIFQVSIVAFSKPFQDLPESKYDQDIPAFEIVEPMLVDVVKILYGLLGSLFSLRYLPAMNISAIPEKVRSIRTSKVPNLDTSNWLKTTRTNE